MRNKTLCFYFLLLTALSFFQFGCKKLITIETPDTFLSSGNVYENEITAIAVLTDFYASMHTNISGANGLSVGLGLSSDELTIYPGATGSNSQRINALYLNKFNVNSSTNDNSPLYWSMAYSYIFKCNAAIEGLSSSKKLSQMIKQQLLGEAKFLRAYFYFYLINLYGTAPIPLTSDPVINNNLPRVENEVIFKQIIDDLKEAQILLSDKYLNANLIPYSSGVERVRPTSWAATALLAKTYLYSKDYVNAEIESTKLIDNSNGLFSLNSINSVFLKNSNESIFALQPVATNRNSEDAITFLIPASGPTDLNAINGGNPVYLSDHLLNSFEPGDQRRVLGNWISSRIVSGTTYYYPFKYKATTGSVTEYLILFRLGEQYMIRAEARIGQNKLTSAISDINTIRAIHGGLASPLPVPTNQTIAYNQLLHERQVELFCEMGHRWLDIKRLGKVDEVMNLVRPLKINGGAWDSYMQFYPIPFNDLLYGRNLIQTPGY